MKGSKKKQRLPDFAEQGLKAMQEAVDEVYAEAAREGRSLPIWDDKKKKVVWIFPKKKSVKSNRGARARRNGKR